MNFDVRPPRKDSPGWKLLILAALLAAGASVAGIAQAQNGKVRREGAAEA